ncbi:MAG: mechanosensitive ion channel family protein [Alphaproteobacteria bacterium]
MANIFERSFYGNTLIEWTVAAAVAVAVILVLRFVQAAVAYRIARLAKRTETRIDDLVLELVNRTKFFFLLIVGVYAGAYLVVLPEQTRGLVHSVMIVALLVQAAIWISFLLSGWITRKAKQRMAEDAAGATTLGVLGAPARLAVWVLATLLALDNLGIDVTALIAGLGIGGVAIALATQNILGDLFASLSIVLDRPFVVGDFIIIGNEMGTVERIGLKTTRVRALSGEIIVFSNNDLLQSRVRNYKQMLERRAVFGFGVTYQTPIDQLEAIPGMVAEIIEAQPLARLDRIHFKSFGDSSLDYEVVFYMTVPEYARYMDAQQAINLALMRRFEKEGIEFAYPTRTLFIERGESGAPLAGG